MEIPVLIEQVAGNGYRAKTGGPLELTAEGATREQALDRLRAMLRQPPAGSELSVVDLPGTPHPNPWVEFAGMYDSNDPLVQEWIETMAENRRQADAGPDVP